MNVKILILGFLFIMIFTVPGVTSHPGNTASDGCHFCRSNCESWGYTFDTRHGHNGEACSPSKGPIDPLYSAPTPTSTPTAIPTATQTPSTSNAQGRVLGITYVGDCQWSVSMEATGLRPGSDVLVSDIEFDYYDCKTGIRNRRSWGPVDAGVADSAGHFVVAYTHNDYGTYHYVVEDDAGNRAQIDISYGQPTTPTATPTPTPIATPTPTPTPLKELDYILQPVIVLPNDTLITGVHLQKYQTQVDQSFQIVQTWYAKQLGGKTFTLKPAIVYTNSETEIRMMTAGWWPVWYRSLWDASAYHNFELCNPKTFWYLISPVNNAGYGWLSMQHFRCNYSHPGTAATTGVLGRLIGNMSNRYEDAPWYADEMREAQGSVAHEIAHGFNLTDTCCTNSIMYAWWTFEAGGTFSRYEKKQLLRSPFISKIKQKNR